MADKATKKNTNTFKHRKKVKKDEVKEKKKGKSNAGDALRGILAENKVKKKEKAGELNAIKDDESAFNLEDIIYFGGEKEDYEKLLKINAEEELETGVVEDVTDNLHTELQNFMQAVGFEKFSTDNNTGIQSKSSKGITDEEVVDVHSVKKKKKNSSTTADTNTEDVNNVRNKENKKTCTQVSSGLFRSIEFKRFERLLLKNSLPWYELTRHIPKSRPVLYENEIEKLHDVVNQYWETETELYQQMKENDRSSDAKWLRTVLKSGTLSDKVAALTMLTQESPVHCMKSLEALMNMSKKKARREALIAIDSLRHIWIADLLPDYKLRKFDEFPVERLNEYNKSKSKEENIKVLITMMFEDCLRKVYEDFVEILQTFSKDPLADIRNKILGIVFELLQMKPEQEQALLSILVNKLGDPERKVASKSSYLLCQLVAKHPNMKLVVIKEVERMMYRPNMSDKAQYYAICFLNQTVLSHEENKIASTLISIYFSFFKVIVSREDKIKIKSSAKESSDAHKHKLLSGLLTGVNRAYPYVEGMDEIYDDQLNTLFRLTHVKHLSTSVQAFMLIYQVMESRQSVSDRYYQALYAKLLDPDIHTSTKHTMFLNLLFKSLKNDPVLKRVKAFIKRLLQICTQDQPALLCAILYLISEVVKNNPGVNSMMMQPEDEDEEERFVDAVLDDDTTNKLVSSDVECENKESAIPETNVKGSWTFIKENNKQVGYNSNHRNPLYAGAEKSCLWEILPILSHFHPSVMHFATSIVNAEEIGYKGDPSQDFTLMSFLDRFMYRNPKQREVDHGSSLMQRKETSLRRKEQPVNSKSFLQKGEENVPCDQVFFYRYFKQKMMDTDVKKEEKEVPFDTEFDNVDDIDFAGEMKRDGEMKRKNKNKKDGSDSESEEEEESIKGNFDYDNVGEESSEDDNIEKENYADKDYEKALFETLDSDGESINEETLDDTEMNSMFAAAEEFSHMLEGGNDTVDGVHHKQIQWEEKQEQKHWKFKKNHYKGNMKRKKNFYGENKNIQKKKVKK